MKSLLDMSLQMRQLIDPIIRIVVRAAKPEKVILHGLHATEKPLLNYHDFAPVLQPLDLVVVVSDTKFHHYEIQDIIENSCVSRMYHVNATVYDLDYVNRHMRFGSPFFSEIRANGILIYDSGKSALLDSAIPNWIEFRQRAEEEYNFWWGKSVVFHKSATLAKEHKENSIAAFFLHQAVEQFYCGFLLLQWGFKPTTHNLDKLRRYLVQYSWDLAFVFEVDSNEGGRLFGKLSNSYIGGRYKADFVLSDEDIALLFGRVDELLRLGGELLTDRLNYLNGLAASQKAN